MDLFIYLFLPQGPQDAKRNTWWTSAVFWHKSL